MSTTRQNSRKETGVGEVDINWEYHVHLQIQSRGAYTRSRMKMQRAWLVMLKKSKKQRKNKSTGDAESPVLLLTETPTPPYSKKTRSSGTKRVDDQSSLPGLTDCVQVPPCASSAHTPPSPTCCTPNTLRGASWPRCNPRRTPRSTPLARGAGH